MTLKPVLSPRKPEQHTSFGDLLPVCRLGLATRGGTHLLKQDVLWALERGINYLNWPGQEDGMSEAIRSLSPRQRERVVIAAQLGSRHTTDTETELDGILRTLGVDYIDLVTHYYVETEREWQQIIQPDGAQHTLEKAREAGKLLMIGLTSHQRSLAAGFAQSGKLDALMIRYNAAHRGAEQDVFPITDRLQIPVITYTGLRWGELMKSTPDDPVSFIPPSAPMWYRFVISHPSVSVSLMAPNTRQELESNLTIIDNWEGLTHDEYRLMVNHALRVRQHAGHFP